MSQDNLLEVRDFSLSFRMYDKGLRQKNLQVIDRLSLALKKGEVQVIVGSSGSGKSLLASAILGLLPQNGNMSGEILYNGEELNERRLKKLRGRNIAYVPQSVNFLDPRMKVGRQVQGLFATKEQMLEVFAHYELGPEVADYYPYQLSGGMARRVLISAAVINKAEMVIADEPTPGMSPDMAIETLNHFKRMAEEDGTGVLIITHDIDLALLVADRVSVFYAGTVVEIANRKDFSGDGAALRHPYSRALWKALPQNAFEPISGVQPYAGTVTSGCTFADRCPMADEACRADIPLRSIRGGEVRCCHAD